MWNESRIGKEHTVWMHGLKFNTNCMTENQRNNSAEIQVTRYASQRR